MTKRTESDLQLLAVVTGAKNSGKSSLFQCLIEKKEIHPSINGVGTSFPDYLLDNTHAIKTGSKTLFCHEYTIHGGNVNNTILAASDIAIIALDIAKPLTTEDKRVLLLSSIMRIPHILLAVNNMETVGYSREKYFQTVKKIQNHVKNLDFRNLLFIPFSASANDNIWEKSRRMDWFRGENLLQSILNLHPYAGRNFIDLRFVAKKGQFCKTGSILTGTVLSGKLRKDDSLILLPQGRELTVKAISISKKNKSEILSPSMATVTLAESISASSGQMLARKNNLPGRAKEFDAYLFWTGKTKMKAGVQFQLVSAGQRVSAFISTMHYSINVSTLHRTKKRTLSTGDIGRVRIQTGSPIFYDSYKENRLTGSFILKSPESGEDAAVGIIRGVPKEIRQITEFGKIRESKSTNVIWEALKTSREDREKRNRHKAGVFWFTGLSASGKSTIAKALESRLFREGYHTVVLDGDNVRHGLCGDLGFSDKDRTENIRRVAEVAALFYETGHIVICTFISPFKIDRDYARTRIPKGNFFEVYVKCDINVCKKRDPKGLYQKAIQGRIPHFTGISSHYEEPQHPEITLDTAKDSIEKSLEQVYAFIAGNLSKEKSPAQ